LILFAAYVIIGLSARDGYESLPVFKHVKNRSVPRNIRIAVENLSQKAGV
jgi:hypothetical protein